MLCILIDYPRSGANLVGRKLFGYEWNLIEERLKRAGLLSDSYAVESLSDPDCLARINAKPYSVILALDEQALRFTTGKRSIWKWHLSPLDALPEFQCRKVIPSFHPDQIRKEMHLGLYLELAIRRAAQNLSPGPWVRKSKQYLLNPCPDESISVLEGLSGAEWLSIDIETGRNQINTFGVAWSSSDAIAIRMLPDEFDTATHYKLWSLIAKLCESDSKKVMQNGIYERMYLSRYGIQVRNFAHDTMCAMKLLWPELEKGLDNVGRLHTNEPYWKDGGRVSGEEGKQKDWGDIRDWNAHLNYNCDDTAGTFEAMLSQRILLKQRNLLELYDSYIAKLFDPIAEMCQLGLPLNPAKRDTLIAEYEARSAALTAGLSQEINPRSSKQKIALLTEKGIKLSKKKNKVTGVSSVSADELSLKKAKLTHPNDIDLTNLLEIAGVEKALSSYLRVRTFSDNRIRFMLDPFSTETGRMSCGKDPWDGGFNAQTMTSEVKAMIEWPETSNRVFVEIDLSQAESRFVAMDACEETLLGMLERKEDIHRYVAAEIYNKPMKDITHEERQLGKKSGHGANYSMGAATFQDSCLKEMDLVIDRKMAEKVLESYHRLFPKIRVWHRHIRETVYRERRLTNPLGLERYFYGRMADGTFREAYAYRPQSTIPMITNWLMLALVGQRTEGYLKFNSHAQVHDSLILSCAPDQVPYITEFATELKRWHPEVILPAGKLLIPTETKAGRCLGNMKKVVL